MIVCLSVPYDSKKNVKARVQKVLQVKFQHCAITDGQISIQN